MATDALKTLHTALIDTRKGYQEAVSDADSQIMKAAFKDVLALHTEAHVEVHRMLEQRGITPDESGSMMAAVHETVIGVRSALFGLKTGSLASFASGEEHNLAKYDAAIEEAMSDSAAVAALERHRSDLAIMVAKMKAAA